MAEPARHCFVAGTLERWRIEASIRREIREALNEVAPSGALY
jgi:hypothetical protein